VSEEWYLYDGDEQSGPLSIAQLRLKIERHPSPGLLEVWHSGMTGRQTVADCPEIFAPPPLPEGGHVDPPSDQTVGKTGQIDPARRRGNFVMRYWRGEFSLGVSYWVFGFLGGIAVAAIVLVIRVVTDAQAGYDPKPLFFTTALTLACVCAYTVWQLVGVWRSAGHNAAARRLAGKRAPWARIAQALTLLGVIRLVVDLARASLPQLHEFYAMAFQDDPAIPAYSIRVMRDGREAEIAGGIKFGLAESFERILQASPNLHVVHLTSLGGRVREAEKLNRLFGARHLITYVPTYCYSACTIAFAAGQERILAQNARLRFHGPAFPGISKRELEQGIAEQKTFFRLVDINSEFIDKALATPNKDLWKPGIDELLRAHVITGVSDGTRFAASGFGGSPTKQSVSDSLAAGLPTFRALRERYPEDFDAIAEAFFQSVEAGQSSSEAARASSLKWAPILARLQPQADDDVVIDLGNVLIDEYGALNEKRATVCYEHVWGKISGVDAAVMLPKPIRDRENAIEERVVKTARDRPAADPKTVDALWRKVGQQLKASGATADDLAIFAKRDLSPEQQARYCTMLIKLLGTIVALPADEAAPLMRKMITAR